MFISSFYSLPRSQSTLGGPRRYQVREDCAIAGVQVDVPSLHTRPRCCKVCKTNTAFYDKDYCPKYHEFVKAEVAVTRVEFTSTEILSLTTFSC